MTNADTAAPGWYDDGTGRKQWWDGSSWSGRYADQPPPRKSGKKWPFIVAIVVGVIAVAGIVNAVTRSTNPETGPAPTASAAEPATQSPVATPTPGGEAPQVLTSSLALQVCQAAGDATYPYGFKIHSIMGVIANEMQPDGTWLWKAEVTVENEYGNKTKGTTMDCVVGGTPDAPQLVSFNVY